ncbi:M23 family metallopeptidase [Acinetobacter qingfengensis]|uniref:LysM domain-containing protein n=1 Tax=Acinetobacter qingfengensis TaxID=1262585 RepID=A0A1E7R989_9GAMM|nr:M23 family metallopeptidase [Acinetobacter qingfengensis]KAA8735493.1 M23 family metallopeptidase [Acinetobacter qingfengensis]OEY95861.1 hypothetical protein BJI46_02785 [Acinetobacter qingfengensis]
MSNKKAFYSVTLISATLLMVGCASQPTVSSSRQFYIPEYYTVQPGDSLSKIAARYNLDYTEIARLNNINTMDKIYVSQSLRLRGSAQSTPRLVQTRPIEQPIQIQRQSVAQQAQNHSVPEQAPVVQPQIQTGSTSTPTVTTPSSSSQIRWVLPSKGPILQRFNLNQDIKGLFFGGNSGDPIYAAAAGEVVYADDGLKEYGKLILIRHTNGYITAYAHNSKLLTKVGDKVQAGQKIAEMGNTGTNRTWLQFQIRLDGKPIDPSTLLPIS